MHNVRPPRTPVRKTGLVEIGMKSAGMYILSNHCHFERGAATSSPVCSPILIYFLIGDHLALIEAEMMYRRAGSNAKLPDKSLAWPWSRPRSAVVISTVTCSCALLPRPSVSTVVTARAAQHLIGQDPLIGPPWVLASLHNLTRHIAARIDAAASCSRQHGRPTQTSFPVYSNRFSIRVRLQSSCTS
jgi:hypothetical protein